MTTQEHRAPDGVWWGRGGPSYKRLSGAISAAGIDPWNFAHRRARMVRNPWAKASVPPLALGIDELNPEDDRLVRTGGTALGPLLGVPEGWPE